MRDQRITLSRYRLGQQSQLGRRNLQVSPGFHMVLAPELWAVEMLLVFDVLVDVHLVACFRFSFTAAFRFSVEEGALAQ